MARKLAADMMMSSNESIAEDRTAIDPVKKPVISFTKVRPVAVAMEMRAARILRREIFCIGLYPEKVHGTRHFRVARDLF
jgi:hypothetical protein